MRNSDGTYAQDIQCIIEPHLGKGGIFISNVEAASNPRTLAKHHIGAVITAVKGKNMSNSMPQHIEYLYIPAIDHESFDLSPFFETVNELLDSQTRRTNVLVHCMAGVSRSATLVIAYLMKSRNIAFNEAFSLVKSKRKIIHPNSSFVQQLKKYEKKMEQQGKKRMDESTSSSWYRPSSVNKAQIPSKPTIFGGSYDQKLRAQIQQLFQSRQSRKA